MMKLGKKVRDPVTGFVGIVVARTEHLGGTAQVQVEPELDQEGKVQSACWFEEGRVESADRSEAENRQGFDV